MSFNIVYMHVVHTVITRNDEYVHCKHMTFGLFAECAREYQFTRIKIPSLSIGCTFVTAGCFKELEMID